MRKRKLKAHMDCPEPSFREHRRSVSTEQLISKFKSMQSSQPQMTSGYLVASITDALSQFGLPEVPQEEIYDVLGDLLSACKAPQHSSVKMTVNEGIAMPAPAKMNVRSRRKKPSEKLQPKSTMTQHCFSPKIDSKHPDNQNTISSAEPEEPSVKHKVGRKTDCNQHTFVTEDSNMEEAHAASSGDGEQGSQEASTRSTTMNSVIGKCFLSPFSALLVPFVELERLTSEEIVSSKHRPSPLSPGSKKTLNQSSHAANSADSQSTHKKLSADSDCVQEESFPGSDETHLDDSVLDNKHRKELFQEPVVSPLPTLLVPFVKLESLTAEIIAAHCSERRNSQLSSASKTLQHSGNVSQFPESKETLNQSSHQAKSADSQRTHKKHAACYPDSDEAQSESAALSNRHQEEVQEPNVSPLSTLLAPSTFLSPPVKLDCLTSENFAAHCPRRRQSQLSPVSRASEQTRGNVSQSPMNKKTHNQSSHAAESANHQRTPKKLPADADRVQEAGYVDSDEADIEVSVLDNQHSEKVFREPVEEDREGSPSLLMSLPPSPSRRSNSLSSKTHLPVPERKARLLLTSDDFVEIPDVSPQPEPKLAYLTQTSASGRDDVRCQPAQVSQDLGPKPATSQSGAQGLGRSTRTYMSPSRSKPAPVKKKFRVRFTPLQEEALVYGVMKYGCGSWKYISDEGWFDGRRTTELSDKYRNLEKYGHLPGVRKRVKLMLAAGVNPLKELRAWNLSRDNPRRVCDHSEQPGVKALQRLQNWLENTSAGQKDSTNAPCPVVDSGDEHHEAGCEVVSSSDDDYTFPKKKAASRQLEPIREAAASSEAVRSSAAGPSTSSATSVLELLDSDSDSSPKEGAMKTKGKRKRVPFTPLEEEALVSGYLKYGKGNWARILREGGFVGRTSVQLSDKFRNLVQYRRLTAITNIVNAKIAREEDPLLEMRKLTTAHWRRDL